MKKKRSSKKFFTLILSVVLMLSMSVQVFAATSAFGTGGSGSNPFSPRGYSIVEGGKQYWLQSNYTHTYKRPTDNVHSAIWADTTNPSNPLTQTYYVTSGQKQMYAWVDKGQDTSAFNMPYQRGFTSDPNVDVRNFFVVSINDGPFVSIPSVESTGDGFNKALRDRSEYASAPGYISADPDGLTGDWVYPLTFTLKSGTKYTFAYARGLIANNNMSLILSPDKTAGGIEGYAGVLQGPSLTQTEKDLWAKHCNDIYQYVYGLKEQGTGVSTGNTVYKVDFKDFYHTCQTYADLTALNSKLTEATTFAGSVTDNDYKLGNYRKASVQALNTLIDKIKAETNLNKELQTYVDDYTNQLSIALNYAKEPAILVKGITLDKNRADMNVGDVLTLKATVSPENADDPTITWTSSNDKVATVENGVVKAVSAGDVTITATTVDGGYAATCAIEVKNHDKSVASTDSSVGVNYNTSALPAGVSVGSVKNIVVTSGTDKTSIEKALSNIGYTNLLINDVQLLDVDGKPITSLSGNVTVKIKVPDGAESGALCVFWYNPATGKLTNMNATQQNGYLLFTTNHFSYYVVAKANATTALTENPKTSDNIISPIPFGVAAGLSFAILIMMNQYRRRKNQAE